VINKIWENRKWQPFESCFKRLNTLPNQLYFDVVTPVIQYARFGVIIWWCHITMTLCKNI